MKPHEIQESLKLDAGLFVPLATKPFNAFRDGTKTVEIRQDTPRWSNRHVYPRRRARLRRGYSTNDNLTGVIGNVWRANSLHALPELVLRAACINGVGEIGRYFDPEKPVVAFEVLDAKEATP